MTKKNTHTKMPALTGPIVKADKKAARELITLEPGTILNIELEVSFLEKWDKNPRNIKNSDLEKLRKSLEKLPTMIQKRPLLVNLTQGRYIVYGGNMRLAAARIMGMQKIWCCVEAEVPEKRMREEALKDNIEYGQWDMDIMADEFTAKELKEMDLPDREHSLFELDAEEEEEEKPKKKDNKSAYVTRTFTLAAEQADLLDTCIAKVMNTEQFKYMPTYGNQNLQGNALFLMAQDWSEAEID